MDYQFNNENKLRDFLLGNVSEDERATIEDRFLADEEFASQILVVEDELIESYLRNELTFSDKENFEKAFLAHPRRRERVLAVRGIIKAAKAEAIFKKEEKDSPSLLSSIFAFLRFENAFARYAFAFVALLFVLGGALLLLNRLNQKQDNQLANANTAQPTPQPSINPTLTPLPMPSPETSPTPSPSPVKIEPPEQTLATIILRPTIVRDPSQAQKLVLSSATKTARLQLNLERDDYKSYVVRITTVEGRSVWQGGPIYARKTGSGTKAVVVNLPTKLLSQDDYIIELSGVSEAGPIESFADYFFSVKRS